LSARFCSPACKQSAYRTRLGVTPNVTVACSVRASTKKIVSDPSEEVFRYVPHADIPKFIADGWELLPALDGTHHGEYSALMRRRV
jgi:hypothetical protein